jgi:nitrate reductase delta subunit
MGVYSILAEALCYPVPGHLEVLQDSVRQLPAGTIRSDFSKFVAKISELPLAAWEELHTRTLDLNPPAAPYIGYQTWGDSYQRGAFMSMMNRAIEANRVDTEGELPDHLIPILRLLDQLDKPFPELEEVLAPALERIQAALVKVDPENPYVELITAILETCLSITQASKPGVSKT